MSEVKSIAENLYEKASDCIAYDPENMVGVCRCCGMELDAAGDGHRADCLAVEIIKSNLIPAIDRADEPNLSRAALAIKLHAAILAGPMYSEIGQAVEVKFEDRATLQQKAQVVTESVAAIAVRHADALLNELAK